MSEQLIESWICGHGIDVIAAGGCADCDARTQAMLDRVLEQRAVPRLIAKRHMTPRRVSEYQRGYDAGYHAGVRQRARTPLDVQADDMCPNCVTPWKCNGPHLSEQTPASARNRDEA